jgi:hypothetical protein
MRKEDKRSEEKSELCESRKTCKQTAGGNSNIEEERDSKWISAREADKKNATYRREEAECKI